MFCFYYFNIDFTYCLIFLESQKEHTLLNNKMVKITWLLNIVKLFQDNSIFYKLTYLLQSVDIK